MREISIDDASASIYSSKTKEYFDEVIKSYYNESYRSVVVMLYSIAITDLIYKLEDLKDLYNDHKAISILSEIDKLQTNNPNSPDWETKLIELVKTKTNLLEPADYINVLTLQKHRHLCAHPVLNQSYDLYKPNKETARAHIKNCLDGILTKPPMLSRDVFNDFADDLERNKTMDDNDLKKHLKSKYLKSLNFKTEKHLFRSLWRITFKAENAKCEENREINLKALKILMDQKTEEYYQVISEEKNFYSELNEKFIINVVDLLNNFPLIFDRLNISAQIMIRRKIERDFNLESYSLFLNKDIRKHIYNILQKRSEPSFYQNYDHFYVKSKILLELYSITLKNGYQHDGNLFIIKMFGYSPSFDSADSRFENLIRPNLSVFSRDELKELIICIDDNSQIRGRKKAYASNIEIKNRVDQVFNGSFDYTEYRGFLRSVGL